MNTRPLVLVDVHLDDGLHAVEAVTTDGTTVLWLIVHGYEPGATYGCSCARCAPHERLGPLPAIYAARTERAVRRCGGVRADGGRCRAEVPIPGARCHWHRASER